ncbi:MAG: cysteine synthase [Euryarchaeota archaeon]|nr:cysteine synthase [Euryarchaeota archaeon]|tara:strand:- start:7676 stop:8593 length:918 start_codon:yes stop_codon:yes gene_type:complete
MTAPILDNRLQALEELRWHVGNTPLHTMVKLSPKKNVTILAKLEWQQFGGSIKARAAYDIISQATISGALNGRTLIDASTGNTGIAFGIFGAISNIPVSICLPKDSTSETKHMLKTLGVEIIETENGIEGARDKALEISQNQPDKFHFVDQLTHDSSVTTHYNGTGKEIWFETGGRVTHFVTGIGTSGTLTGVGRKLRELNPNVQIIGLQPDSQAHIIEGWRHLDSSKIPGVYDPIPLNELLNISDDETIHMMVRAAKEEGLLLSPSSAANLVGALKVANSIDEGTIVTVLSDDIRKYKSLNLQA